MLFMSICLCSLLRVGLSVIPIGFIVAGIYFYIIRPFEVRWRIRREFAKRPDSNIDVQWNVTPEGISTATSLGSSEFQWIALAKVVQTPDGFLFYQNEQIFHFLPRRGFRGKADF